MFTDHSKAFDTIDHTILLKKLKLYSIGGNNHNWTKSFPSNRKQCIEIDPTTKVSLELVKYGIPQGSVLAHSYFFLCVNDLKNASSLLDLLTFADDKNLFDAHKIYTLCFSKAD